MTERMPIAVPDRPTADSFVREHAVATRAALVPEIALYLAREPHGIFQAAEALGPPNERFLPFWAFAWPGGQAAARFLLDNAEFVRGRSVLDIGAGSGIAAIAAAMSGAADVLAADVDPVAIAATTLNARENGVGIRTTGADLLGTVPEAAIVLVGDLVYEPALATRVSGFLDTASRRGTEVLLADRTTARRPPLPFDLVAEYDAPVTPELTEARFERARLWRLRARSCGGRRGTA